MLSNIEKVRRIFPTQKVIQEGDDIIIDDLVRLEATTLKVPMLKRKLGGTVPAWDVICEGTGDSILMEPLRNFRDAALEAVRWYAGFQASEVLEKIRMDEWAEELAEEKILLEKVKNERI